MHLAKPNGAPYCHYILLVLSALKQDLVNHLNADLSNLYSFMIPAFKVFTALLIAMLNVNLLSAQRVALANEI